jgi:hypothetical protein
MGPYKKKKQSSIKCSNGRGDMMPIALAVKSIMLMANMANKSARSLLFLLFPFLFVKR